MKLILKYLSLYRKPFFLSLAFMLLEVTADLMQPTILSFLVDRGIAEKNMQSILHYGLLMLLVTCIGAIGAVNRNMISSRASMKIGRDLRSEVYKKIQSLSFGSLNRFETASLVTRLTNDVVQVQNFIFGLMRIFVRAPLLGIGGIVMGSIINPRLGWIFAVIVPVVVLLIYLNLTIGFPLFTKVQNALDRVNGIIREYLSGVRVVKAFNRFSFEEQRFEKVNSELTAFSSRAMRVMAAFGPGIALTVNIGIVAVLWMGGAFVNKGHMHVGQIMAFLNYMTQILFSLGMISFIFNTFVRARASAARISEVLETVEGMAVPSKGEALEGESGRIDFSEVTFSYPGASGLPVLRNISFECNPGETLGIIGSTGSGKSSLVGLIPRFYDTDMGCVRVNGADVKEVGLDSLRDKVAIVPQKTTLFSGSIEDNIKWGNEYATEEEIHKAAIAAEAHDFIQSFPEQYRTLLGQGGVNLSGGQKQRISIARALVRKPEILILDDSTSAVDTVTEARIRRKLKEYACNMTCIIIAQRISSVMEADRILVLENGSVAGFGNHNELIQSCAVYQEIYRSQIGKEAG